MTSDQMNTLMRLYAAKFIQRRDPVAVQTADGSYRPMRDSRTKISTQIFNKKALYEHISGLKTYGHYMLDPDSKTKLFVLDIDLNKMGFVPTVPLNREDPTDEDYENWVKSFQFTPDLRSVWHDETLEPAQHYIKYQLRVLGGILANLVHSQLEIPTAVAYSGNKGIHVYGFTGITSASSAVDAAELVLESTGYFAPLRGDNFYADTRRELIPTVDGEPDPDWASRWNTDGPLDSFDPDYFSNFGIELFPKQRTISGDGLGNLVRLPLGKNLHAPSSPTYFVDLASALTDFREVDPVFALTTENPWQTPQEAGFTYG